MARAAADGHQGFKLEIGDAVYAGTAPDIFGRQDITLTLEASFTNEGDSNWRFSSDLVLVTPSGTTNPRSGGMPNVLGEISYRVDEHFDISTAYLLVGDGNEQQAHLLKLFSFEVAIVAVK